MAEENASLDRISYANVYRDDGKTLTKVKEDVPIGTNVIYDPVEGKDDSNNNLSQGVLTATKDEDGTITLENHPTVQVSDAGVLDGKVGLAEKGVALEQKYIMSVGFKQDGDKKNLYKNDSSAADTEISLLPTLKIQKNKSSVRMELKAGTISSYNSNLNGFSDDVFRPIWINVDGAGRIGTNEKDNLPSIDYNPSSDNFNSTRVVLGPTTIVGTTTSGGSNGPWLGLRDVSSGVNRSLLALGVDVRTSQDTNTKQYKKKYGYINLYKWDGKGKIITDSTGAKTTLNNKMVCSIYGGQYDEGVQIVPRQCYRYITEDEPDDLNEDFSAGSIGQSIHRFKNAWIDNLHGGWTPRNLVLPNNNDVKTLRGWALYMGTTAMTISAATGRAVNSAKARRISNLPDDSVNGVYIILGNKEIFIRYGSIYQNTETRIYVRTMILNEDGNNTSNRWRGPLGTTIWHKNYTNNKPQGNLNTSYTTVPRISLSGASRKFIIEQEYIDIYADSTCQTPLHLGLHSSTIKEKCGHTGQNDTIIYNTAVAHPFHIHRDKIDYQLYFGLTSDGRVVYYGANIYTKNEKGNTVTSIPTSLTFKTYY